MSVARNTEISVTNPRSFEAAIKEGIDRATKTLRNVRSAWVQEQEVKIENNQVVCYHVTMIITFVLEDGPGRRRRDGRRDGGGPS